MLLYGKPVAESVNQATRRLLKTYDIKPKLVVIRISSDEESTPYMKSREKLAKELGIEIANIRFDPENEETDLPYVYNAINVLNEMPDVHGILLERPIDPKWATFESTLCGVINPAKDVDGCQLTIGESDFYPCTAEAVIAIMNCYKLPIEGSHIVVVGRSRTVGTPLQLMLTYRRDATVTLCHSKTSPATLEKLMKIADTVVFATGNPHRWNGLQVGHANVIDVGTTFINGHLCGDFDPSGADKFEINYTPVPGGVGAVTTALLMNHVAQAAADTAIADAL